MTERRSPCPVAFALDVFGDKWTLLLVRDMAIYGRHHYADFERAPEGISTNILANRLKMLQCNGIIEKTVDPDNASRRVYRLTDKGVDLLPVMLEMMAWSAKHDPQTPVTASYARRLSHDRKALLAELQKNATGR